ncbi:DUF2510 domain-containing protein [Demequina sp. NBRC 110052]|uniref:DUF2510 domain-containing protein n=1 Tax=Demequina sp. NBRC 110052 TaxID=1570341 RepID=UPI00117E3AD4|nr:DUF2510 domain-containing protein [Demequina sp. NBRC 110052]
MTFANDGAGSQQAGGMTAQTQGAPAAGWYQDPHDATGLRWWDGAAWSEHTTRPDAATAAASTMATFEQQPAKPKRGAKWFFSLVGTALVVFAIVIGKSVIGGGIGDFIAELGDGDERTLTAKADGWTSFDVLAGHGTIQLDPAWEDAYDLVDGDAVGAQMSADAGTTISVEGAWITETDADGNSNVLFVMTVPALPGGTTPKLEVEGFIGDTQVGEENTVTETAGPVVTGNGLHGYVAEFSYDLYGWSYTDAVGSIIEGKREVIVYASNGSDQLPTGIVEVETVLNSLVLND